MKPFLLSLFLFAFAFLLTPSTACAQTDEHEHDHDHAHGHKNEIGIANSPVYFIKGEEFAYGLHLHYIRTIHDGPFGVGVGYERIFDDHKHNTFHVVFNYRPIDRLSFNLAPGITYEGAEGDDHHDEEEVHSDATEFAIHFETTYEWDFNDFHIGPAFEVAYDPSDWHISLGLHVGYGF